MANIRNLKKDIDYLVYELLSDCATFQMMYPEKNAEKVSSMMNDAFQIRLELIKKVNNPVIPEGKKIKTYYKDIYIDLFSRIDDSFKKLSELAK